jgi:hypothetical protein
MEKQMADNDGVQEPTVIEPTEPQEPQEPVNEGGEAPEAEADQAQAEPAQESEEPLQEEEPEEEYQAPDYSQFRDTNKELPLNEDGTVDPVAFRNQLKQEIRDEMRFERSEERNWMALEKKYPQLKGDREVREILLNQRIANAVQGKETNLAKIAEKLYGRIGAAKSEGRAQANVSTRIQKAASLETATANTGSDRNDKVYDRIMDGDKGAANDLLSQWLEQGKI